MTSPTSRVGWRVSAVQSWLGPCGGSSSPSSCSSSARTIRLRAPGPIRSAAHGARRARSACSASGPRRSSSSRRRARTSSGGAGRRARSARAARRYSPVPPAGAGGARAASSPSISACASWAYSPALKRASTGRIETSRCSRRACSAVAGTPVSVSRPRYTCSASAETATGRSPRARSRSASANASAVLPTPVGPKMARTAASPAMARSMVREVSVRIGCGLSTSPDPRVAAIEAGTRARAGLGGAAADVAFLFCTGRHLAAPEATLEGVAEALDPPALVGCGAGGVLGAGREIESGTAVAVWAAALGGGMADAFHAEAIETPDGVGVSGLSHLEDATAAVLLPDPYTFPTDAVLGELGRRWPGTTILGGLASARTPGGDAALFVGNRVVGAGAVGVRFHDVEILPCVSQGAAPVGPELTVTASEGNVIHELAGRPALERLRDAIEELTMAERGMVASGLLLGVVIDGGKPESRQGDFLVRPLLGADPDEGTVAVGAPVEPGSIVRMHARDARSADRDLHESLGLRVEALGGAAPAGALVFTCNGRGRSMFGAPDHDALALDEEFAGAPAAGFFAAGEIGPVGGDPFLHGFTATVAVFPR